MFSNITSYCLSEILSLTFESYPVGLNQIEKINNKEIEF